MPSLSGKTVVFTGSLSMTRNEATAIAINAGARVTNTIGWNHYLVVGDKPGSKLRQARSRAITILTEKEFLSMASGRSADLAVPLAKLENLEKARGKSKPILRPDKLSIPVFSAPDVDLD